MTAERRDALTRTWKGRRATPGSALLSCVTWPPARPRCRSTGSLPAQAEIAATEEPHKRKMTSMEQVSKRFFNWASILEPQTRAAGREHRADAVHLPAPGADAGRAPGQGRHGRERHPDARRDNARCGRGGHRLRDARGPDPVHRRGHAPAQGPGQLREAIERPSRCRPATTTRPSTTTRPAGDRANWRAARARSRLRRSRRTGGCNSGRSGRATTSSRSASTSTTGSGCSCTPVRGASATSSPCRHIKIAQAAVRAVVDQPARPRPRLPRGGNRRVLGVHPGPALGAALRAAEPRRDDGPRRWPAWP